jgi:hypothetical protein
MTIKPSPRDDQRETQRASLHVLEHQYAWISTKNGEVKTRIIDFSPFGLGVVLEGAATRIAVSQGEKVSIQLQRDGQDIKVEATLVTIGKTDILKQSYTRLGFKISSRDETPGRQPIHRSKRFALNDVVELSCFCDDPSRQGQKAFFTIRDISIRGLFLETSARNKFLLPSLKLAMSITIPGSGTFSELVKVKHVHPSKDRYLLGCEFAGLSRETVAALGDFCLIFGKDVSYQIMIDEGFPSKVVANGLTVHATATYQDFMQITRLRLEAEHARGRQLEVSDPWQMIDEHDDDAQHVCVKLGKKVVASARLVFNQGESHVTGARGAVKAEPFAEGFATVSKIALEPEFEAEKSYVYGKIWTEIFRLALQSQMASMLIVHPDNWPKELATLGLKPMKGEGSSREKISRVDLKALFEGRHIHFISWCNRIAPLTDTLIREHKLTITNMLAFKLRIAKLVRRLTAKRMAAPSEWPELQQKEGHESPIAKG